MSDVEERALAQALRSLVADAPTVPDLARRAQRGHRRGQIGRTATLVATTLVVAGAGVAGVTAISGGPQEVRPAASGPARSVPAITRELGFDAGALRITPPLAGSPVVDEARAVSLFRSTGLPDQLVQEVTIGYGRVTLKADLAPGWRSRAAWIVVYRDGPHGCPETTGTPRAAREGRRVFVLDATNGTDALDYQEAGSRCGAPVSGPTVRPAEQYVSLPWSQVGRAGQTLTLRYRDQDCTGGPATLTSSGSAGPSSVTVIVGRPMKSGRCGPGTQHTTQMELASEAAGSAHAPTGPVTGLFTSLRPSRFDARPAQP